MMDQGRAWRTVFNPGAGERGTGVVEGRAAWTLFYSNVVPTVALVRRIVTCSGLNRLRKSLHLENMGCE
jgi:hypothetical protein